MKEIFDWLREQITNVWKLKENPYDSYWNRAMYLEIKKENDKKEDAMRKMQEIINEAEAKWEVTEAELRAKVIDEFAERMKTICKKHQLGIDRKLLKPTYLNENGIWHSLIDDVVAQMKGEKE